MHNSRWGHGLPPVNGQDERAGVKAAYARHVQLFEGWDAAEGVLKGGAGGKVAVDGIVLLIRSPVGESPDDLLDVLSCKG
jgi:hypothetical protein